MQVYTEPKQLPCLHVFCRKCLNNVTSCPLCEDEVCEDVSGSNKTLPCCFYMKNLLDILAITECSSSKVTCGNCKMKSGETSYCFCCGEFWCDACILRADRDHRILALKDFQEKDLEVVLKRQAFCQKEPHGKEVLKFYCKKCNIPVCQNCVTVEHSKHEMEYLEVTVEAVKQSMAAQLDDAEKETRNVSNSLLELEEESREIEQRSQFVKKQIQDAVQSIILALKQREAEVERETKKEQDRVTKDKTEISDHLRKIEDDMSRAKHFIDCSTAADLVRAKPFVSKLLQEFPSTEMITSTWKTLRIVFVENKLLSESVQNAGIGRLEKSATKASHCTLEGFNKATTGLQTRFKLITRNAEEKQSYSSGDCVVVELASTEDGSLAGELKIVDNNNGSYEISCIPKRKGEHKFTACVNGEEISDLPTIHVKKRSYKLERTVGGKGSGVGELNAPWGIAVTEQNEIIVCNNGNNRLEVFCEEGDFIKTIEHELLTGPRGICIDSTGCIYVTAQNKILKFDPNGEYVKEICDEVNNKGVNWSGISVDEQGNIIACYNGIHVLSPEGKLLKKISAADFDPFDCLYCEGKIFVSNWATNTIDVFGCDGEFLQEIGKQGSTHGGFSRPTGLAIDKTGHLIVADDNGVQVFTLDGLFITKFGGFVLSNPYGVSVSKSGRIIVSDENEDQLTIF